ncbi:cell wall protein [Streptomyces nitrosporeus]|uniref:cell wall protein n=1 Tax=Streptomyces nitrosporeus TaxID=28894 RepID=UPI0039A0F900
MRRPSGAASCRASSPCPETEPPPAPEWVPVPNALQELDTTASRHAQPGAWLRAVAWLVGTGLHPRARTTTLAVAHDLARRMDYDLGLVLYDLKGTATRCRMTVATVKRHVRVLRELGALVWKRHGSKRNLHLLGRPYTATATIYAATVPALYDTAMGHRLDGTGYHARVRGVTDAGRDRAITTTAGTRHRPVDNPLVDHRRSGRHEPHSLDAHHDVPPAELGETLNYTPRMRAASPDTPPRPDGKAGRKADRKTGGRKTGDGRTTRRRRPTRDRAPRRSPLQVAHDIAVARQVRPLVSWTQSEGLRRLAHALRPLIDHGLDAHAIAAELHGMALTWRPRHPAAYITAVLARDHRATTAAETAGHPRTPPPRAFSQALATLRTAQTAAVGATRPADDHPPADSTEDLTSEDITLLRSAAATDPALILTALENLGELRTRRLYTDRLVDRARLQLFGGPHITIGDRR